MRHMQRGGFALGLVIGLLLGLGLALGVALYVTKVPVPFVNKVQQRTPEQDAAEIERNKKWDPNAALGSRGAVQPPPGAASSAAANAVPPRPASAAASGTAAVPALARNQRDSGVVAGSAAASALKSTKPGADPFAYFVQAGAFARSEDAEQQRARLAMLGFGAKVTEREQSGRTVYRVRLGPYDSKEDGDAAQGRLQAAGVEAALVRVER